MYYLRWCRLSVSLALLTQILITSKDCFTLSFPSLRLVERMRCFHFRRIAPRCLRYVGLVTPMMSSQSRQLNFSFRFFFRFFMSSLQNKNATPIGVTPCFKISHAIIISCLTQNSLSSFCHFSVSFPSLFCHSQNKKDTYTGASSSVLQASVISSSISSME